jgi:uncharacterized protein (TIGR00369 family)
MIWYDKPTVQSLNARCRHTMVEHLGIQFTEVADDCLKATMPHSERTQQYMGILHGGASCALGETIASVAANFCIPPEQAALGQTINGNHMKAVQSGQVVANTWPWHIGRVSHVWHFELRDEHDTLIHVGRITMAIIERIN